MTAIWKPRTYNVLFRTKVKAIKDFNIPGQTGSTITAPYLENQNGLTFIGWTVYETEIYRPGDEIPIKGQEPGLGISATAVWKSN